MAQLTVTAIFCGFNSPLGNKLCAFPHSDNKTKHVMTWKLDDSRLFIYPAICEMNIVWS